MEPVALAIWGTPSDRSKTELRFGANGSVSINLTKGTWYDHEAGEGGGVIDALKQRMAGVHDDKDAFEWLEHHRLYHDDDARDAGNGGVAANYHRHKPTPPGELIATYIYTDESGQLLFEVQRFLDRVSGRRSFRQRHETAIGGWINNIRGIRRVPYRLPDLIAARQRNEQILIVEGEKDVENCFDILGPATCNPMGAGKWPKMADELNPHFQDADVIIIGDNDEAGHAHALDVVNALQSVARSVRMLDLKTFWPDCPHKGDISDWITADGDSETFWAYTRTLSLATRSRQLVQSSAEFVRDFTPPDYLIDGILQRRFLYAFTGKTGSGKTAVVLLIAVSVAIGRNISELEVEKGRVLYFAGENPDDVRMRWIAMSQQMDFDVETIDVYFVPGRFKISEMRERIIDEMQKIGGDIALIVIDTSAAYYEGKEVNSNTEQAEHARLMRTLIGFPGGPCVLVNCHPVKNAAPDNLIPLGAGAFLNEIDGNLTCAIDASAIEVYWQGKFRGPDFEPLSFEIASVTHERLVNSKGRKIPTVIARHLSDAAKAEIKQAIQGKTDQLLLEISKDGKGSVSDLAIRCGWISKTGKPQKSTTHRLVVKLRNNRLVAEELDGFSITEKGKKRIAALQEKEPKSKRNERNEEPNFLASE